jgi:hypothetical protein
MWYHPKYYEELRKKRKELERQASSNKHEEASSDKPSSIKRSSDKRLSKKAMKIHEAWCIENGYLKPQATSVKLPGSRYKSSDYSKRAT